MRIVADSAIPGLAQQLGDIGELLLLPTEQIVAPVLASVDALLVRTLTRVDGALARGQPGALCRFGDQWG